MTKEKVEEKTVVIDDKTYKESDLPQEAIKYINLRAELLNTRARVVAELERCDVILNYYIDKVKEAIDAEK
tara:strand:+ start:4647 stop:4859 length:213 start_codon:yes stop_codon:yes gene_type:complete